MSFRADRLDRVVFRMGILAGLRSKCTGGTFRLSKPFLQRIITVDRVITVVLSIIMHSVAQQC